MRGISEERLIELCLKTKRFDDITLFNHLVKHECVELNDWKPIDENTPKNRPILLLTNDNIVIEGYDLDCGYWVDGLYHDEIKPKAWKELPSLPKE